jgi:uncharacterized protein YhaN
MDDHDLHAKVARDYCKSTEPRIDYPRFLRVDRTIAEVESELKAMESMLATRKIYLAQLKELRKKVTPADEAKIQALISVGLL